jgi:dephospho-CoA kinase
VQNSSNPYVIGLIGNLGAGKSQVRRMLERLGGLGIDADLLSHRVLAQNTSVYQQVVDQFGTGILNERGGIERAKLALLVFSDADRLAQLERLIHPAVETLCEKILARTSAPFVVIEAIKLLESKLVNACDSIWSVQVPLEIQVERVMRTRGMTRQQAMQRIQHQSQPEEKAHAAQVMIDNSAGLDSTWKQVAAVLADLRNSNEQFSQAMQGYESWKNRHHDMRLLQPANSTLTRKLITAAQPVDWVNGWISAAMHRYAEQFKMVSRANYFEMLVNFQGLLHQPAGKPELLSILQLENFILQPLYLFQLNQQKPADISGWLGALQVAANHYFCEAILLPISRKNTSIINQMAGFGYEILSSEDELCDLWQSEVARTRLSGYNVLAKKLHHHLTVD